MNKVLYRFSGGAVGLVFAAFCSAWLSRIFFNQSGLQNAPNADVADSVFILTYGPVICGASVTGGIAGAMANWYSSLAVSLTGMLITSIPIAAVVLIFGTLGGIDRFGGDRLGFFLYLLKGFAWIAAPLLVAPAAGFIGHKCTALTTLP